MRDCCDTQALLPFCSQDAPDWQEILTYFRGSELQNYFTRILEDDLHAIIKPQYVDHIPKAVRGNVEDVLIQKDGRGQREHLQKVLELEQVLDRDVEHLSGMCCLACPQAFIFGNKLFKLHRASAAFPVVDFYNNL